MVWDHCVADAHNRAFPNDPPQVVVVTPDQSAPADANKVFFKTVSLSGGGLEQVTRPPPPSALLYGPRFSS